jgi:transposase-like protein
MAKARRKRKTYTSQQRTTILSTAQKEGLTAAQVQRKFGVTPVTYYSWRKKSGVGHRRVSVMRAGRRATGSGLSMDVRNEVRTKVQKILPEIVRSEVNSYLSSLFSTGRGRRRLKV